MTIESWRILICGMAHEVTVKIYRGRAGKMRGKMAVFIAQEAIPDLVASVVGGG